MPTDRLKALLGVTLLCLAGCLTGCSGIPARDIPVYQREAAMISLASGRPELADDYLYASLEKLDPGYGASDQRNWTKSVAEWARAGLTDARSLSYIPDDYELILMMCMRTVAALCHDPNNMGDLYKVQERQQEIFDAYGSYDVPEEHKVTPERYHLVAFPHYLYGALQESDPGGGQDRARQAYQKVIEIQEQSGSGCPLAQAMVDRTQLFTRGGGVHVVGFLGQGPIKVESRDDLTPVLISVVSIIVSAWSTGKLGGANFSIVKLPYPALRHRVREVAGMAVSAAGESQRSSVVTDISAVAEAQYEARKPWIIAQAVFVRLIKTAITVTSEQVILRQQRDSGARALTRVGFFVGKLLWEATERADTRCWTLLPDTIQAARLDLPPGNHRLQVSAVDPSGTRHSPQEVEVEVERGRNTFIFVFYPSLRVAPSVLVAKHPM